MGLPYYGSVPGFGAFLRELPGKKFEFRAIRKIFSQKIKFLINKYIIFGLIFSSYAPKHKKSGCFGVRNLLDKLWCFELTGRMLGVGLPMCLMKSSIMLSYSSWVYSIESHRAIRRLYSTL
mgnify:CR=1 FL=1